MTDRKLNAYYYSFDSTGNDDIDSILEAVAMAGKAFHNTDEWAESHEWMNDGVSVAQAIQNAANSIAEKLNK